MLLFLIFLGLAIGPCAFAQPDSIEQPLLSLRVESLASGTQGLPFWLTHNQYGRYTQSGSVTGYAEALLKGAHLFRKATLFYEAGVEAVTASSESDFRLRLVAGAQWKQMVLTLGQPREPELLEGLSTTNGSLTNSVNYRPFPGIGLATRGFIPLGFTRGRVSLRAEYREGMLTGSRSVNNARLHFKALHARYQFSQEAFVEAGVNHFVMWGGKSKRHGQLPQGFSDYFRYVFGCSGDSDFLPGDQINIAGNQLGSYHLAFNRREGPISMQFYLSHPFEDRSGMELDNWRDNLYGIYLQRNVTKALIRSFVYEYTHTKHQSGFKHNTTGPKKERMRGLDNYFNHGVYGSGFTFDGYSMGTPLLTPAFATTAFSPTGGPCIGFSNTRIAAHHIGLKGDLSPKLTWKGLITYSRNFGTYWKPFGANTQNRSETYRQQISGLLEIVWNPPIPHWNIRFRVAADKGQHLPNSVGGAITLQRSFALPTKSM